MDALIRQIIRNAQKGDPAAWERIELALRRQLVELVGLPIWIVRYSHRHGTDLNVFLTAEDAYQGAKNILDDYWEEEMEGEAMPEDIVDAISMYNDQTDEYIDIEESHIRSYNSREDSPT
jgi:hypothetical protein